MSKKSKTAEKPRAGEKVRPAEKSGKSGAKSSGKQIEKSAPSQTIRLSSHLAPSAVLDLIADSKEQVLRSLAEIAIPDADKRTIEAIYNSALEREATVNTYVGDGVAIPHARLDSIDGTYLALARNARGLPYDLETEEPVRLVVLVVGNVDHREENVAMLGRVARVLKEPDLREKILAAPDGAAVRKLFDATQKKPRRKARPLSYLLLSHANKIARELGVTSIIANIENREDLLALKRMRRRDAFIVATGDSAVAEEARSIVSGVILLPRVLVRRDARVRLTAFMALSHGLVKRGDVSAFISGHENGGLDSMTILEMGKDVGRFVTASGELSRGVLTAVLERTITIAAELAAEGREGSPVGTIFVIGDPENLAPYCQQMVMNPFHGYPEEQRNILDPLLAESIKEFAAIDGAFVVRGDGVVVSAGTYLKVSQEVELPGGYGSRHRVACAVTQAAECVAVALSQSTGEVTLFRKGTVVLSLPRTIRLS